MFFIVQSSSVGILSVQDKHLGNRLDLNQLNVERRLVRDEQSLPGANIGVLIDI